MDGIPPYEGREMLGVDVLGWGEVGKMRLGIGDDGRDGMESRPTGGGVI